jgi:Gluconate 2-dehydrogenase subunit 3
MSMRASRRQFLAATAALPLIRIEVHGAAPAFTHEERDTLRAAMDEIVPASDGMPAASEIGGVAYLERIAAGDADVAKELHEALRRLQGASEQPFDQLDQDARVATLQKWEARDAIQFAKLRDYVYESYYTQPQVWKLIGYEFYPTDHEGPHMEPFDESILDGVRKMPKLYRDA